MATRKRSGGVASMTARGFQVAKWVLSTLSAVATTAFVFALEAQF